MRDCNLVPEAKKVGIRIINSAFIKRLVVKPIMGELPFFMLFLLAISIMPFRLMLSHLHWLYWDRVFNFLFLDFPRAIAISYVFLLFVYYSRSKVIKLIFYSFASLLYATSLFLHLVFHKLLQPDIIVLIAETNRKESSEFVSSFLFSMGGIVTLLLFGGYLTIIFVCEKRRSMLIRWVRQFKYRMCCAIVLIVLIFDGLLQFRIYHEIISVKSVDEMIEDYGCYDSITTLFYSLYSIHLVNDDMKQAVRITQQVKQQKIITNETDSLNIVYVIGESYIKHHSQLYGYSIPTTPNLCQEKEKGNLFVFDDVVSPFNQTSLTMKNTLSTNSLRSHERWFDCPYFPAIFKKAGYHVYFWDVQKDDSVQALFEFSLNSFVYDKDLVKEAYTQISRNHFLYDDQAVSDFSKEVTALGKCNLVIFHLMGQHIKFSERYPHNGQFDHFSFKDIKASKPYLDNAKKQLIAEYDNATRYNDYVLKHIIDLFRNKNTVVVNFADHGEEVYDYRNSFGRLDFEREHLYEGLKCQYEIPFMIWCSDQYIKRYPHIVQQIKCALRHPFRTDDICQVIFHLAQLPSAYYRKQYDLLSPSYQVYDRVVGEEQFNYDRIVRRSSCHF